MATQILRTIIPALLAGVLAVPALGAGHDPKAISALMKDSKISLLDGIAHAESNSGPATSAKFEIDNSGKLILSVYTIPEGLAGEPEKATLTEVSALATESPLKTHSEIFPDKEHIARASVHMTMFKLSKLDLKAVVELAQKEVSGAAIDVRNPMVRNRRAVADVIVINGANVYTVTLDLAKGKVSSVTRH